MNAACATAFRLAAACLALLALSGCGSSSGGSAAGCPLTVFTSCQAPTPSWSRDVQPIINRSCAPCHLPGGVSAGTGHDFSTYAVVSAQRATIKGFVETCMMPLDGGARPLATADGDALLDWIACGAPDN